jgi:hypothetical protein
MVPDGKMFLVGRVSGIGGGGIKWKTGIGLLPRLGRLRLLGSVAMVLNYEDQPAAGHLLKKMGRLSGSFLARSYD